MLNSYRIHSNYRTGSIKCIPLLLGCYRAFQELPKGGFRLEIRPLFSGIQPFSYKILIIFTKVVITWPKIDRFSIRNHRWKAENELYHFLALYKHTVRLLERIRYFTCSTFICSIFIHFGSVYFFQQIFTCHAHFLQDLLLL